MRVFVSYASEDRLLAETVVQSIRTRGHVVFFDKDDLPAGETYEDRIESAVARSDVFVFLISPHSVEPGGFALTELGMARRKWKNPAGRLLPVMAARTDYDKIPAYAKSVSVLEPEGNVAAETAARVDAMRRLPWPRLLSAAVLVLAVVAGVAGWFVLPGPKPQISVVPKGVLPWQRGFFGAAGVYNLGFGTENKGDLAGRLTRARLVATPVDALKVVGSGPEYSTDAPTFVAPGGTEPNHFRVVLATDNANVVKWRVCVTEATRGEVCSTDQDWSPTGDFSPATAFTLPPDLSERAVAVARHGNGFVLAARSPNAVYRIGAAGTIDATRSIEGEPTALHVDGGRVYVGARGPDALVRLVGDDLAVDARATVAFPGTIRGAFDNPVSSTPVSIVRGGDRVWIVTRGGAAASGVMHFSTGLDDPQVPPYFASMSYDVNDMHLASNGDDVWGMRTNVTPSSLYKLSPATLTTYTGHEHDIASCASDILVRERDLLVPDCEGRIQTVVAQGSDLRITGYVDHLLGYKSSAAIWTIVNLRSSPENGAAYLVNSTRTSGTREKSSIVSRIKPRKGLKMPIDLDGIEIRDAAFQGDVFIVILENAQGRRETLALRYE